MGVYGTTFRTALALTVIPLAALTLTAFNPQAPAAGFPLIYTSLVAGLIIGILGSAMEAFSGGALKGRERFAIWAVLSAIVLYFLRLLLPHLPFGLTGSLVIGIVLGFFESLMPDPLGAKNG